MLPAAARHPDAGRIYPAEVGTTFTALWDNRQTVYAALDELPTTFTHNDVFLRNLRRVPAGTATRNVAFDWAYCGTAPIGAELAPLVGATIAFLGSSPGQWDELERLGLSEYVRGVAGTRLGGIAGRGPLRVHGVVGAAVRSPSPGPHPRAVEGLREPGPVP